jgi:hypothetical protein
MAYSDPRKNAKFVDDNHLRTRDLSGGPPQPRDTMNLRHSTDFGQTGASNKGGEADDSGIGASTEAGDEDEIVMKKPSSSGKTTGSMY